MPRKPAPKPVRLDYAKAGQPVSYITVQTERVGTSSGRYTRLYELLGKLAPGMGVRIPFQGPVVEPDRAARTVHHAVRAYTKKHGGSFGTWALADGVFVWRHEEPTKGP